MSARPVLDLGHCGKIPIDTLFELHLETRDGHMITIHQSKMARSLGSWVSITGSDTRALHVFHSKFIIQASGVCIVWVDICHHRLGKTRNYIFFPI